MRLGNRIYRPGDRAEGFRGGSDAVGKPHLPAWGSRRLFFLKLTPMVWLGNRTIGVNLGIFSSVFESLKGCVFSSTFLKSASMVKRLFYGFQSFAKCRF